MSISLRELEDKQVLKADKTYVDQNMVTKTAFQTEQSRIDQTMATKAELATERTRVDQSIATKASTTTVNTALAAKADSATVNTALAAKADKTYVDQTMATKSEVSAARTRADQAFQQANDGKAAVASAITVKGVSASPTETFSSLASKIGQIETGIMHISDTVLNSEVAFRKDLTEISKVAPFANKTIDGRISMLGYKNTSTWYNFHFYDEDTNHLGSADIILTTDIGQGYPISHVGKGASGNYYFSHNAGLYKISSDFTSITEVAGRGVDLGYNNYASVFQTKSGDLGMIGYDGKITVIDESTYAVKYKSAIPSWYVSMSSYVTHQQYETADHIYLKAGDSEGRLMKFSKDVRSGVDPLVKGVGNIGSYAMVCDGSYLYMLGRITVEKYDMDLNLVKTYTGTMEADHGFYDRVKETVVIVGYGAVSYLDPNTDTFLPPKRFTLSSKVTSYSPYECTNNPAGYYFTLGAEAFIYAIRKA
jgi:hypothetical protein